MLPSNLPFARTLVYRTHLFLQSSTSLNHRFHCVRKQSSNTWLPIPKLALLIDGDQIATDDFGHILDALSKHGEVAVRRVYTFESRLHAMRTSLTKFDITPVLVPVQGTSNKNITDMSISWDAAILATSPRVVTELPIEKLSGIALASADADYSEILRRLKILRNTLPGAPRGYIIRPKVSSLPQFFEQNVRKLGGELVEYERPTRTAKVRVIIANGVSEVVFDDTISDVTVSGTQLREARNVLLKFGYLFGDAEEPIPLQAVAKFFYANSLGPLVLFPPALALNRLVNVLAENSDKAWVANPGDLIYIVPTVTSGRIKRYGTTRASIFAGGGGPIIFRRTSNLVADVLHKLGYAHRSGGLQAAVDAFWELNAKHLEKSGFAIAGVVGVQRSSVLEMAFSSQLGHQTWRMNPAM